MKKIVVIFVLGVWCILDSFGESIRCTGFEATDNTFLNQSKNVSCEILEAGKEETIPEGKRYLKVSMTLTDDEAWISLKIPNDKIHPDATKITMWIKGSTDNKTGTGPCLCLGNWLWNGWKASRIIDVSESEWVKYEFKTDDFLKPQTPDSGKIKINEHQYLWINFNKIFNNSGTIKFCIDDIEIE